MIDLNGRISTYGLGEGEGGGGPVRFVVHMMEEFQEAREAQDQQVLGVAGELAMVVVLQDAEGRDENWSADAQGLGRR